jgi:hypothetical protein
MKRKAAVLILLLCGLCFLPAAQGQKLTGELTLDKGIVKIRRQRKEILLQTPKSKVPLYEKDVLQTGPQSRVTLKLRLKKFEVVRLYGDSYLTVEAVKGDRTTIVLSAGKAEFSISRPAPGATRFEVKTHRLFISAAQAKFIVGVETGGAYVAALEGEITVTLAAPQQARPGLRPGNRAALTGSQAIISTAGEIFSTVVEVSQDEVEELTSKEGLALFREMEPPPREQASPDQGDGGSGSP